MNLDLAIDDIRLELPAWPEEAQHLRELFRTHQNALLAHNLPLAIEKLGNFQVELQSLIRTGLAGGISNLAGSSILPDRRAGLLQSGAGELTAEHKAMLDYLSNFFGTLLSISIDPSDLNRKVKSLLKEEKEFTNVMLEWLGARDRR